METLSEDERIIYHRGEPLGLTAWLNSLALTICHNVLRVEE